MILDKASKAFNKILFETSYLTNQPIKLPQFITINLTFKCNFRCLACDSWKMDSANEIDQEQWLNIADKILNEFPAETAFDFSGGEPLLKADLLLLLISRLSKKYKKITLNTNGYLLNESVVDKLIRSGLKEIKISLYSNNAEIHDNLRGLPQAHENANKAIELLKHKPIDVELGILLTVKNIDGVQDIFDRYQDYPRLKFNLQLLDEIYKNESNKDVKNNYAITDLCPKKEQVELFFSRLKFNEKVKNKAKEIELIKLYYLKPKDVLKLRCFTGVKNLIIDPWGKASLCFKRASIGDLTKSNIMSIVNSQAASKERISIKNCKKHCRAKGCNYFRGIKEIINGY